ncbi:MAG: poly(A) polymerase/tRNA-nucleotidyltransferase [Candidatus Pelagibacterales bacterium]|nr:MAG: poly(A) polymerase/tRNA-nucleotidyltransferase [Pelagibacterales bacterium]
MSRFSSILEQNDVAQVFDLFETYQKNSIFVVGGAIRDALLNREITDIDFATSLEPKTITEILNKENIKFIDVGINHGTVTAIINERKFEITTFRNDIFTDGRHAQVSFSNSLEEDALRRDFTINAMYLDKSGNLIDPTDGKKDLENRVVRFIGNPDERIKEDYLRILRYFRFLALFGDISPDAEVMKTISANLDKLSVVSKERQWNELKSILSLTAPNNAISAMSEIGLLDDYFNGIGINDAFVNLIEIESRISLSIDPILRLSTLIENSLDKANTIIKKLPLSKSESTDLLKLSTLNKKIVSYMSMKEVRYLLYLLGRDGFQKQILVNWAKDTNNKNEVNWRSLYEVAQSWEKPSFALTAKDVINMGISQGPMVGDILKEVEDWWAENDFIDDKFSLIERLKAIVQSKK